MLKNQIKHRQIFFSFRDSLEEGKLFTTGRKTSKTFKIESLIFQWIDAQ